MTDDPDGVMDDDGAPPVTEPRTSWASPTQATTDDHVAGPPAATPAPSDVVERGPAAGSSPQAPGVPLVPILGAATAILLVLTILFGLMAFAPQIAPIKSSATKLAAKAQEDEELKAIAKRFATNFVTIDYRTIDADLKRMTADATGNFREQLERTIDAIGTQFKKSKASSKGKALDSAVLSHEEGSALVQVLLQRTKRNVDTKGSESGNQIVNVALVKTPEGWKVDNLSQLGAEGG
jgi:Mce-associated membrane protein